MWAETTGRDTYCEFFRKPLPQMSKISDMGYRRPWNVKTSRERVDGEWLVPAPKIFYGLLQPEMRMHAISQFATGGILVSRAPNISMLKLNSRISTQRDGENSRGFWNMWFALKMSEPLPHVRKYRMAGWDRGALMGVSHRAARFQKKHWYFLTFSRLDCTTVSQWNFALDGTLERE